MNKTNNGQLALVTVLRMLFFIIGSDCKLPSSVSWCALMEKNIIAVAEYRFQAHSVLAPKASGSVNKKS